MPLCDPYEKNRGDFEVNENSNVFVIMRYAPESPLEQIESAIKDTLKQFRLRGVFARELALDPELWQNVRFCMDHCRYAIAVFDRAKQPDFNPNVTLELGYMLALKRPCLILKDQSMPTLHSDIIGRLYWPFDPYTAANTVSRAVATWLKQLGHSQIQSAETITADTHMEANKRRTRRILAALSDVGSSGETRPGSRVLRQAASLSSLAISDYEAQPDAKFHKLICQERDAMLNLLRDGWIVRVAICPESQIDWVELQLPIRDYVKTNIFPRYQQLIDIIRMNIENQNLQIVYTLRLPHDNLLIIEGSVVFIGRRRRWDPGFPYTTAIFDPAVIHDEIGEFDATFGDSAGVILKKNPADESDFGSPDLKQRVVRKLQNSRRRLQNMLRTKDNPAKS